MPYCLETISATSKISMESSPSPSPYKGASGSISCGLTSRLRACTNSVASSRWRPTSVSGAGWSMSDALSDIDLGFRLEFYVTALYRCGPVRQLTGPRYCEFEQLAAWPGVPFTVDAQTHGAVGQVSSAGPPAAAGAAENQKTAGNASK